MIHPEQTITLYTPLLYAIAFSIVRCRADAEDIVQDTFVKWLSLGPKKIDDTKAYLVKAVRNNCLNHVQSLRKKKEELFGQHNFSDIINRFRETNFGHLDLEVELSRAVKVLQTKLEPLERAVFLLREVFDFDYEVLQEMLDKKKDHCRQLLSRAKKKLSEERAWLSMELRPAGPLLDSLKRACDFGHASELVHALKAEITASLKNS
jgi:RNA polymerase sigma-70 factor (ECF subfamily)